jgi:hypothetical protein
VRRPEAQALEMTDLVNRCQMDLSKLLTSASSIISLGNPLDSASINSPSFSGQRALAQLAALLV